MSSQSGRADDNVAVALVKSEGLWFTVCVVALCVAAGYGCHAVSDSEARRAEARADAVRAALDRGLSPDDAAKVANSIR